MKQMLPCIHILGSPPSTLNWPFDSFCTSRMQQKEICIIWAQVMKVFFFFRATPATYKRSQARVQIGAASAGLPTPQPQQHRIQVVSATYTTAHSNAGSLTHRLRLRIESTFSWILVRFITLWITVEATRSWKILCFVLLDCFSMLSYIPSFLLAWIL